MIPLAWKIVSLVVQFLIALAKFLPKPKSPGAKEPSQVPSVDEPGKALERARKRSRAKALPN